MTTITKEHLKTIAQMSAIKLNDQEFDYFNEQITLSLNFVEQVTTLRLDQEYPSNVNVNVFRDDIAVPSDGSSIIEQAPASRNNYFVVPSIIPDK